MDIVFYAKQGDHVGDEHDDVEDALADAQALADKTGEQAIVVRSGNLYAAVDPAPKPAKLEKTPAK